MDQILHWAWVLLNIILWVYAVYFVVAVVVTLLAWWYARRHGGTTHWQWWPVGVHIVIKEDGVDLDVGVNLFSKKKLTRREK